MSSCEICGKETDSLTKIKLEGTTMKACDDCKNLGTPVKNKKKKRKKKKKSKTGSRKKNSSSKVLVSNYGEQIQNAREEKDLTQEDLADRLNEKQSFIQKVENGEMKPPRKTASKMENFLGIELYTEDVVTDPKYKKDESGSGGQTIGDMVDLD